MKLPLVIGLAFLAAAATAQERPAASARVDPWTYEGGVDQAKAAIAQCLERAESDPAITPASCVRAAFLTCENEHGNMSQRDLNECAFFSQQAWESRLALTKSRLMAAKIHPLMGMNPEPRKRSLSESDRRWEDWNKADCEMQTGGSVGGTMHRYQLAICLSDHAAHRALELDGLLFWWGKLFELPEEKPTRPYEAPRESL